MVLESLIDPLNSEKKFLKIFFLGILYVSIAVILSLWIFKTQATMIAVSLTVFASIPLIYKAIKLEEKKDQYIKDERKLLGEHLKVLLLFSLLFLGFLAAFTIWYVFLPDTYIQYLFSSQLDTIRSINSGATAHAINSATGNAMGVDIFMKIFFNNFKVLLFCILFSFFYGAGAIFILTWNASVIACAIGNFIKMNLEKYAIGFGLMNLAGYFHVVSMGLFKYLTHGLFEIFAFFVGGLAGGIISVAVIRHDLFNKNFKRVVTDSLYLVGSAILLLVFAALVEVYVTPIII